MNKCLLNEPPHFQCCCNCVNKSILISRTLDGHFYKEDGYICTLFLRPEMLAQGEKPVLYRLNGYEHEIGCECYVGE